MNRAIGIVQARIGSTRLLRKVVLPLNGSPAIVRIMDRMLSCEDLKTVYLATSDRAENDILAELAHKHGWNLFRGSEHDVLSRFACIVALEKPDIVARINADNFAICPEVVSHGIEFLVENGLDVCTPFLEHTYPFGAGAEVSTAECLARIDAVTRERDVKYREHIYFHAYEHRERFRVGLLEAPSHLRRPDIDISVDTEADYRLVEGIYRHFEGRESSFSLQDLIAVWDACGCHGGEGDAEHIRG